MRVKAGAFAGERGTPLRIQFDSLPETPLETVGELTVRGMLDAPEVVETVVFLRQPAEGAHAKMQFKWNGFTDAIIRHPDLERVTRARLNATKTVEKLAIAKAPRAEIDAVKAEVEKGIAAARVYAHSAGAVAKQDRFAHAFTQKMLTYALGRPVGYTDNDTVQRITGLLAKDDYKMQALLVGVVTSEPFLTQ